MTLKTGGKLLGFRPADGHSDIPDAGVAREEEGGCTLRPHPGKQLHRAGADLGTKKPHEIAGVEPEERGEFPETPVLREARMHEVERLANRGMQGELIGDWRAGFFRQGVDEVKNQENAPQDFQAGMIVDISALQICEEYAQGLARRW